MGVKVEEARVMADHVRVLLSIPPKYSVSHVAGFPKAKSEIRLARVYGSESAILSGSLLGPRVLRLDRKRPRCLRAARVARDPARAHEAQLPTVAPASDASQC